MVMGKPHHAAWDYICERFDGKLDQTRTLMIGDRSIILHLAIGKMLLYRCDTDISFGNKNGLDTLFVLSGISTIEDIDSYTKNEDFEMIPKFFTDSVKDMLV
jgi:ribonucleotide monophosphatase NagD (HAD superfamily)